MAPSAAILRLDLNWSEGASVCLTFHPSPTFCLYACLSLLPSVPLSVSLSLPPLSQGYTPSSAAPSEYQSIPPEKIEDFGVHANAYYSLEVNYFKSSLDDRMLRLLWNKYWVNTLSSSPMLAVRRCLFEKVEL